MSIFQGRCEENRVIGEFKILKLGTHFEYRKTDGNTPGQGTWGMENGFYHEIAICDGSIRFANVAKTVAYVAVNEDEDGKPVVEKWAIKHIWKR